MDESKKITKMLLLIIGYVFAPIIINKFLFKNNMVFAGVHEVISEAGIALLGGIIVFKKKGLNIKKYLIPFLFLCLAIADGLYALTSNFDYNTHHKPILIYARETAYQLAILSMLIALITVFKTYLKEFFSKIIFAIVTLSILCIYIKYKIIAMPNEYTGVITTVIYGWSYAIEKSAIIAILILMILRSNRLDLLLALQSLLLMYFAEIAISYNSVTLNSTAKISFLFEQSWQISVALLFMLFILNRNQIEIKSQDVTVFKSVRAFFAIVFCLAFVIFYAGLVWFKAVTVKDGLELANLLLVGYTIFFIANLFSFVIANQFLNITKLLKVKNHLFDISDVGRGFKFSELIKKEQFAEINHFADEYNQMAKNADELLKAYIEQSKHAAIGQIAQFLAHDVRKPFSQLQAVMEQFETYKANASELGKAKAEIRKSVRNVEVMLSDIMDYSREVTLDTKPVCLPAIFDFSIRQALLEYRGEMDAPNIFFEYKLEHKYKPLADDERMSRVFGNIIGNAIEAITLIGHKNSGKIWINSRDVPTSNGNSMVEVSIGNDGPRFNQEDIPKLFNSFFTKGKKKGTGLGLASAEKIIRLHGGEISAQNSPDGVGVEFVMTIFPSNEIDNLIQSLPTRSCDVLTIEETLPVAQKTDTWLGKINVSGKTIKVLMLEDEALYRAAIRNTLAQSEILRNTVIIYEAGTVDDAFALLSQEQIQYAIVDIDLGEIQNGFDFLREAKANYPDLRSMVHTNRCINEDKIRAKELGAVAFVSKPLSFEILAEFLASDLEVNNNSIKLMYKGKNITEDLLCYIVDDSAIIRMYLEDTVSSIFTNSKLTIKTFDKPDALLIDIINEKPDIVLSDYHFENYTRMNGVELLIKIKELNPLAELFLVSNIEYKEGQSLVKEFNLSGFFPPMISEQELAEVLMQGYSVGSTI